MKGGFVVMAPLKADTSTKATGRNTGEDSGWTLRVLSGKQFHQQLARERKRSERSQRPMLLLLLESPASRYPQDDSEAMSRVISAFTHRVRENDFIGWYQEDRIVGIIFTELIIEDTNSIISAVLQRVSSALRTQLPDADLSRFSVSFHFFPDDWNIVGTKGSTHDAALYPDLAAASKERRFALLVKRWIDVALSSILVLIFLPLFLIIAALIKSTSKGPVFFIQQRIGQYGRSFPFLKFRSMAVNNNCDTHRKYVNAFIAGNVLAFPPEHASSGVYKLANDDRVTQIGRLLRRTSLDEIPQLINVLCGQMSLVGPRPPIPYELAAYKVWHRNRLLGVKPGITGLWQINGRSRVSFDQMVRMDLHYIRTWSLWLDLKILLQTPFAVLKGAY